MTTAALVYDVAVEAHCPDRVMRQFGRRQSFPVSSALDRVQRHDHSLSRAGHPFSTMWVTRLQPWVAAWDGAGEQLAEDTGPHTEPLFRAYLTWYEPKTRCRLTYVDMHPQPHVATSHDRYARHRDEALAGAFEACRLLELDCSLNVMRIHGGSTMSMPAQLEAWTTQRDRARGILQAFGTRTEYEDSYGSSQASTSVPCGPAWQQPPLYHRQYEDMV
ncbi:uncharacterized protein LOC120693371 [Panicum virgatum]|uniref:uncharacterized protein LOC120693371 n=1 Tax=Panicum virgatum TaxID=38727 RepID=UPI0019D5ADC4|nr:uncharacterized protein LOC120693371 [Panicum virgatum]